MDSSFDTESEEEEEKEEKEEEKEEHPSEEEEVGHKEAEAQLLSARQNAHNTHPAPKVSCLGSRSSSHNRSW